MNANEISPKTNSRVNRIQKVSGMFRTVFFTVAILCALGGLALYIPFLTLHGTSKFQFVLNASVEFACAIWAWFCYRLFNLYSHGELFTSKIVHYIRRVGYTYFLMALVSFLSRIISIHFIRADLHSATTNSEWEWIDLLSLLTSLFPGFLILFIAWIMDEGRKIREEQELTV